MRAEPNSDVLTVGRPAGEHEDAAWPGDLTTPMVKHIRKIRGGRRRRASCIRKRKRQSHFRALDSRCRPRLPAGSPTRSRPAAGRPNPSRTTRQPSPFTRAPDAVGLGLTDEMHHAAVAAPGCVTREEEGRERESWARRQSLSSLSPLGFHGRSPRIVLAGQPVRSLFLAQPKQGIAGKAMLGEQGKQQPQHRCAEHGGLAGLKISVPSTLLCSGGCSRQRGAGRRLS